MKDIQKIREMLITEGFTKESGTFDEVFSKKVDVKDGDIVEIIVKLDYVLTRSSN